MSPLQRRMAHRLQVEGQRATQANLNQKPAKQTEKQNSPGEEQSFCSRADGVERSDSWRVTGWPPPDQQDQSDHGHCSDEEKAAARDVDVDRLKRRNTAGDRRECKSGQREEHQSAKTQQA